MKIITERDCILEVVEKWNEQYNPFPSHNYDKLEIFNDLRKLDLHTCSAEDVNSIIGNTSWTTLHCDECGEYVDWVLQVGEEPDYESNTANLCRECVIKAISLLETLGS